MTDNTITSAEITVLNHSGVHARPASYIFNIAKKYANCTISLHSNNKKANAKSVIAILGLGLKHNSTLTISASGDDASNAINEITQAFANGLGEEVSAKPATNGNSTTTTTAENKSKSVTYNFSNTVNLSGIIASPGLVVGKTMLFEHKEITFTQDSTDTQNNITNAKHVFTTALNKLQNEIQTAKDNSNKVQLQVLQAHLSLLQDETLLENVINIINTNKTTAFAISSAIQQNIEILQSTNDALLTERVADLKDLKRRLLNVALNITEEELVFAENTVIVAEDLVPSDIAKFNSNVVGIVLAQGSATTHVSLILRNMGTTAVVALRAGVTAIPNNTNIIVNGNNGNVTVNPNQQVIDTTIAEQQKLNAIKQENIKNAKNPCVTLNGVTIKVKGNVSNQLEAENAFNLGAKGIGLLRSEFLFFNSQTPPSLTEQTKLYQEVLDTTNGESITIRTLDVGGDKPLPYITIPKEENPIVGIRGVRSYKDNMEVFLTQIKGILSVKPIELVKIMLPMVADVEEFTEFKAIIEDEIKKANITAKVHIGTMIEIPSAALMSNSLAKHADFLSIGTNDLAQYTMAMDRGNPALGKKLSNLSPALLQLIDITVKGGHAYNKPVAVCGAMASELKAVPILVGLGVTELSTSGRSIPDVKALIRTLDSEKCKQVAQQALQLDTFKQVEELINKHFNL